MFDVCIWSHALWKSLLRKNSEGSVAEMHCGIPKSRNRWCSSGGWWWLTGIIIISIWDIRFHILPLTGHHNSNGLSLALNVGYLAETMVTSWLSDLRSRINRPLPKLMKRGKKRDEVPQDGSSVGTYFYPLLKAFQTFFRGLIVTKWKFLSLDFRISRLVETFPFYGVRLIQLNMDLGSSGHFPKYKKDNFYAFMFTLSGNVWQYCR